MKLGLKLSPFQRHKVKIESVSVAYPWMNRDGSSRMTQIYGSHAHAGAL